MKAALSIAFADLRGKAGSIVATRSRSGIVLVPRNHPRNPRTPAQEAVRADMARAARAFRGLNPDQLAAWRAYSATVERTNPVNGQTFNPAANSVFAGLAVKFLQVAPQGEIPLWPPVQAFAGDTVLVTASVAESLSLGRGLRGVHRSESEGGSSKGEGLSGSPSHSSPPPRPDTRDPSPAVIFSATTPNLPGVTTELLLQPLVSPNRTPKLRDYRTRLFVAFTPAHLTVTVPVTPGYYVAAYRFVETSSGQSTPLTEVPGVLSLP